MNNHEYENIKILMISDNPINGYGGGSISERKYYYSFLKWCENNNGTFSLISPDDDIKCKFDCDVIKTKNYDRMSRLYGHSTYMFFVLKKCFKKILSFNPDIIICGRSRFGFFIKKIKKHLPNVKVITCMENVEFDYVDGYFSKKNNFKNKLMSHIEKKCVYKDEKLSIKYSDGLLYLTDRDYNRVNELYKKNVNNSLKSKIIPICLENDNKLKTQSKVKNIIFVGTLSYDSNSNAIKKFINELWISKYNDSNDLNLIIAGKNPDSELVEIVSKLNNCTLIPNFKKLDEIIPRFSMMIAPIEKGAGMKVKIADSLSMGILIAGSDEALVGYQEISSYEGNTIFRANGIEEYETAINQYLEYNEEKLIEIEKTNLLLFEKYYCYDRAYNDICEFMSEFIRKEK